MSIKSHTNRVSCAEPFRIEAGIKSSFPSKSPSVTAIFRVGIDSGAGVDISVCCADKVGNDFGVL